MDFQGYNIKEYKKSEDYVKSPLRYAGGKFYAIKYILPFINCVPHDEYREPFVGGGSVFFAKNKVQYNWLNDLETNLINLYRCLSNKEQTAQIIKMLQGEIATRDRHKEIKDWSPENTIEKAYRTFYLNRTSYCGIINAPAWGYKDGKSSPPENWGAFIKNIEHKMCGVKITNLDFEKVILTPSQGKSTLVYLDPPYYGTDQKRAYIESFQKEDHIRLADILVDTPHHFCLSYDDVEEIRALYSWAHIYERKWLYNTANKKGESRKIGNELIITNYKVRF